MADTLKPNKKNLEFARKYLAEHPLDPKYDTEEYQDLFDGVPDDQAMARMCRYYLRKFDKEPDKK